MPKFWNEKTDFKPKETSQPFLKLENGEMAILKITGQKKTTYKGKEQDILTAIDGDGEKINIADTVLVKMFKEDVIEKNEIIRVTCQGWKNTASGKYRLFEVESAGIDTDEEEND